MKELYNVLLKIFTNELERLTIGYTYDKRTLIFLDDLINAIDYIENSSPSNDEILKIIQYYEEIK